jgi:hypothetical protein
MLLREDALNLQFSWQWIASHWKEENFTKIKSNINVKLDIESDSFLGLSTFNLCDKCPYISRKKLEIMVIELCCRLKIKSCIF